MSWIKFKGVRSDTLGAVVSKMPSPVRAAPRVERYELPGRSGLLHIVDGSYDVVSLDGTLNLNGVASMDDLDAWLIGTGDLVLSDDVTKCYKAMILDDIPFKRQRTPSGKRFDDLSVRFECHPFRFEATPTVLTRTAPFSLTRAGNVEAYPLIQLTATGDITLTIGDKTLTITGVPGSCIIDVAGGLIYSGGTNLTGNADTDDWPLTIPPGTGTVPVSWTGNVSQMIIQPNWGWL